MSLLTIIWGAISLVSVIWVVYDVLTRNRGITDITKIMWIVVALIFGIFGALAYYFIGRKRR